MEKSVSRGGFLKTGVVTGICLLGALLSLYMLWQDIQSHGATGKGLPVAKIERRESKVRRKARASYEWANVQTGDGIFRKDSIQTSSNSAAAVRLNNGNLVEMGENSLIVLDESGDLALNTLRGNLLVRSLSGDSSVRVGSDGKAIVEQMPLQLLQPAPLERVFTQAENNAKVRFSWKEHNSSGQPSRLTAQLQVSKSNLFPPRNTNTYDLNTKQFEWNTTLPPGRYYWRITERSGDTAQVLSATSSFRVVRPNPPRVELAQGTSPLITVADRPTEARFILSPVNDRNPASPEESADAGKHFLEVATDFNFTKIIRSQEVASESTNATIPSLSPGEYFWRIKSQYGEQVIFGSVSPLRIQTATSLPVTQVFPLENAMLSNREPIRFSWKCDTNPGPDLSYIVEIKGSSGQILPTAASSAPFQEIQISRTGVFEWRVIARYQGRMIGETQWRKFTAFEGGPLELIQPKPAQEFYYWTDPLPFSFEWKPDALVGSGSAIYQLEISEDESFGSTTQVWSLRDTRVESTSLKLKSSPNGHYFWRLRLFSTDSTKALLKESASRSFKFGPFPQLSSPSTAKPSPGYEFNILEKGQTPEFQWEKVEGAESYELEVQRDGDEQPLIQTIVSQLRFSAQSMSLKPGSYSWSVRAIDPTGRKGLPLQQRSFVITYGRPLPAPNVTSPEVQ